MLFEICAVGRRGRKRKSTWNVSSFLLRRANADFLPSKEESAYLSQNGLGRYTVLVTFEIAGRCNFFVIRFLQLAIYYFIHIFSQ